MTKQLAESHNITFEKASQNHYQFILEWLQEPHMIEFWDNSQEHKDDIKNFIDGRKTQSNYFGGQYSYWVALLGAHPYAIIMTHEEDESDNTPEKFKPYLSKKGKTFSLDFGIGNANYLGIGLAAPTLVSFMKYFSKEIDQKADTFLIDPDINNARAVHVYKKAGFEIKEEAAQEGGFFDGGKVVVMVRKI